MMMRNVILAAVVLLLSKSSIAGEAGLPLVIDRGNCANFGIVQVAWRLTDDHMEICVPSNCCSEAVGYRDTLNNCDGNFMDENQRSVIQRAKQQAEEYRRRICDKYAVMANNGNNMQPSTQNAAPTATATWSSVAPSSPGASSSSSSSSASPSSSSSSSTMASQSSSTNSTSGSKSAVTSGTTSASTINAAVVAAVAAICVYLQL